MPGQLMFMTKTLCSNLLHKYLMNQSHLPLIFRDRGVGSVAGWWHKSERHKKGSIKFYAPYGIILFLRYIATFFMCVIASLAAPGRTVFICFKAIEGGIRKFFFGSGMTSRGNSWSLLECFVDKLWISLGRFCFSRGEIGDKSHNFSIPSTNG